MKMKALLGLLLLTLPLGMTAQVDDAYFVPSKAKKQAAKEKRQREMQERAERMQAQYAARYADANQYNVSGSYADDTDSYDYREADYHIGQLRNDDEYNRRPTASSGQTLVVTQDTIYFREDSIRQAQKVQQAPEQYYYDEDDYLDYGYSNRLVRFYGGVRSPYYWDYYYDWAYDPYLRYGWNYDPWYYDYAFGWDYHSWYGRPWHSGWYGYYDPYYGYGFGVYYDPWYHGYYHGPGGWHNGHGPGPNHFAYDTYPGRRTTGSTISGMSSMRGSRNSLAGMSNSRGSSSRSVSSVRGGVRNNLSQDLNSGRLTTNTRNARTNTTVNTRNARTNTTVNQQGTVNQRSVANVRQSTSDRQTTNTRQVTTTRQTNTQNTRTYTPPVTTSSSSRSSSGGGFSSSSSSSSRSSSSSSGGGRSGGGRAGR